MSKLSMWDDIPASYANFKHVPKDSQEVAHAILKALQCTAGLTRIQIFEKVKKRRQTVLKALKHLDQRRVITKTGEGRRGKPYLFKFE